MAAAANIPEKQTEIQDPQYLVSQSERLSNLLDVVVAEANFATDPDACVDYLQLTEILVDLLDQSHLYSALSSDQLQARQQDMKSFVSKIEAVEDAVGDWDVRLGTKVENSAGVSKKRARSIDMDGETTGALKRRREIGTERDMVADAVHNGLSSNVLPPILETASTHWWNEPFCD